MPNLTSVTLTAGVPTAGTGTVGTIDNVTGTAGSPSVPVLTVQGVASGTPQPVSMATAPVLVAGSALIGKVGIDQTTDGTTNKVAADLRVAGSAVATGAGASGATVPRVTLASDSPGIITTGTAGSPSSVVLSIQGVASGTTIPTTSTGVDQYGQYETVAASQTAQALGATGASGDYLAYVTVFPGTAGCGVVTILDNATTWGTFAGGGTTALPSLVPFRIDVGAFSTSGAWKITTGANVTCVGVGKFT